MPIPVLLEQFLASLPVIRNAFGAPPGEGIWKTYQYRKESLEKAKQGQPVEVNGKLTYLDPETIKQVEDSVRMLEQNFPQYTLGWMNGTAGQQSPMASFTGGSSTSGFPTNTGGGFTTPTGGSNYANYFNQLFNGAFEGGGPSIGNPPNISFPGINIPIPDFLEEILKGGLGALGKLAGPGGGGNQLTDQLLKYLGLTGLNLFGAIQQQGAQDFTKNNVTDLLKYYQGVGGSAQNNIGAIQQAFLPQMLGQMGTFQNLTNQQQADLASRLANAQSFLGQAFMTPTDEARVPGIRDVMNFTGGIAGAGTDLLRLLGGQLAGGSPLNGGVDIAKLLASGKGGDFDILRGLGGQLTQQGGSTPFTQALQGAGMSALAGRGMTPEIQAAMRQAQELFKLDPSTAMTSARGMQILGEEPLLPLEQVVSMARNTTATNAQNRLRSLKRELMNRTGVTGPVVASGSQNELLTELGDEALQAEAQAVQNALLGQQGLQLQKFGMGGDLYSRAQQGFQGRQGLGLDTLLKSIGAAAGRETGVPGLSLGGGQLDLSRMLGGAGLFGDTLEGQLKALTTLGSLTGQQQQGFSQAANLLNALNGIAGTQQQNVFGLQDLGLKASSNMYNALGSLLGQQGNLAQLAQNGMLGTAGLGQNAQTNWMQLFSDMARAQGGLFGQPAQTSPYASFFQNMSQGLFGPTGNQIPYIGGAR